MKFCPGYYIKEYMESVEMSDIEMCSYLDVDMEFLTKLLNGTESIDLKLAKKLSSLLNTSVELWLNLQRSYDSNE